MNTGSRILIVDDDPATATMLRRSLSRHGFRVDAAGSADEALSLARQTPYDGAVLDLVMPGQDGAALAAALREAHPGLTVALLTGYSNSPLLDDARRQGVAVFGKPVPIQDLVDYLKSEIS